MKFQNPLRPLMAGSLALAFALSLNATSQLSAQAAPTKENPKREGFNEPFILAGLKHLKLYVGKLDAYATEHGESEEHLKQLLTERLSPCHITMVEGEADCGGKSDKSGKSSGCGPSDTPLMYLKVKVIPDEGGSKGAAYSVSLALVEKARISRNKKELMVSVWTKESVGRLGDNAKETIDQQVESVLKDFHRDYLLANSADSSKDVPSDETGKTKGKHKSH
ncbi:MAG: hypothetical protein KGS72_20450 [Cyanobacteria bacterium REEB67]|nr:hypothetical protein [Cyanobacteria bacterium REEB67]